jgi:hypothetical protein
LLPQAQIWDRIAVVAAAGNDNASTMAEAVMRIATILIWYFTLATPLGWRLPAIVRNATKQ